MTNNQQQLATRFAKEKSEGLFDRKFFFGSAGEVASDDVCREINEMDKALDDRDFLTVKDWGDATPSQ